MRLLNAWVCFAWLRINPFRVALSALLLLGLAWLLLSAATLHAQDAKPSSLKALLLLHQGKWVAWDGAGLRNGIFKLKAVREDYIALQWVEDKTGLFEYILPLHSINYLVFGNTDTLQLVTYSRAGR